eukprot:3162907-Rhodomonas_salina.1
MLRAGSTTRVLPLSFPLILRLRCEGPSQVPSEVPRLPARYPAYRALSLTWTPSALLKRSARVMVPLYEYHRYLAPLMVPAACVEYEIGPPLSPGTVRSLSKATRLYAVRPRQ